MSVAQPIAGRQTPQAANRVNAAGHDHKLVNPFAHSLLSNVTYAARRRIDGEPVAMARPGMHRGHAVVCGTGPTLLDPANLARVRRLAERGATVYALKEGVRVLREQGIPVHYSVAIDPSFLQILKTPVQDGVTYALATTCHPALFHHVVGHGGRVMSFHSVSGFADEALWYDRLFGTSDMATGGYTVANRAVWLALYQGHSLVHVAGVPFGWREGWAYYAPGVTGKAGNLGSEYIADRRLDGNVWHTKLDMLASAYDLHFLIRRRKVRIIGDSIALAMARKPLDFIKAHAFDKPHLTPKQAAVAAA